VRTTLRFLKQLQVIVGLVLVLFFVVVAVAAPQIAPMQGPNIISDEPTPFRIIGNRFDGEPKPPSAEAPFGTTADQFDIYTLMVWGTRSALQFGLTVTIFTAFIGTLLGALSGYIGGWFNGLTMRVTDALLTFPLVAGVWMLDNLSRPIYSFQIGDYLATDLTRFLSYLQVPPIVLGFILFSWMPYARLMNANVQTLKRLSFIQASEALGGGAFHVVWKHLIPNSISPALVLAARDVGGMVIMATAFTFIGVGGGDEWGIILSTSRNWIVGMGGNPLQYWWTFVPTTIAIILFGVGWNLLGDGVGVILNPKKS
jgi:peptide/nickel transport system permease protein